MYIYISFILLFLYSHGITQSQDEIFNIVQYNVNRIDGAHYVIKNKRCYNSKFIFKQKKDVLTIQTDSINMTLYLLIEKRQNRLSSANHRVTFNVLAGNKGSVYSIREIKRSDNTYYFAFIPIKFEGKNSMGGDGTILLVSNRMICDNLNISNINYY